jgi:hypothetical protein
LNLDQYFSYVGGEEFKNYGQQNDSKNLANNILMACLPIIFSSFEEDFRRI